MYDKFFNNFSLFQLEKKPTFTKNSCHSENIFWKKWNIKSPSNFEPFCILKKLRVIEKLLRFCCQYPLINYPESDDWTGKFWDHQRLLLLHNSCTHPVSKIANVCALFRVWLIIKRKMDKFLELAEGLCSS